MTRTTIHRFINAPVAVVFDTVAHIENFAQAIPDITNVEFLSDTQKGVGTRFKETRKMKGRVAVVELEVTEYKPDKYIRLISNAGGTIWDTIFTTEAAGDGTNMTMMMDAKPYKLLAKLFIPLTKGMIGKAIEKDMNALKTYCENQPAKT